MPITLFGRGMQWGIQALEINSSLRPSSPQALSLRARSNGDLTKIVDIYSEKVLRNNHAQFIIPFNVFTITYLSEKSICAKHKCTFITISSKIST
ncbi:hypothetical protein H1P_160029 [Hyella patelloides LEGE 07179]|uniref:Uncharacterized protein n=1 Tax=Hyella patelloides LEGE 07179 TaxID=945734 RepID=A0A563VMK9_9CYAN|nr:hypothetical protein H1P_160029 [Hyella patelloides LEGE 07179]